MNHPPNVLLVAWDPEYRVLVDQMGIMLPPSNALQLLHQCYEHFAGHSSLEREAIGRKTVERKGETIALQFNYDLFSEEGLNVPPRR